jgi:hypothetical protein
MSHSCAGLPQRCIWDALTALGKLCHSKECHSMAFKLMAGFTLC